MTAHNGNGWRRLERRAAVLRAMARASAYTTATERELRASACKAAGR